MKLSKTTWISRFISMLVGRWFGGDLDLGFISLLEILAVALVFFSLGLRGTESFEVTCDCLWEPPLSPLLNS